MTDSSITDGLDAPVTFADLGVEAKLCAALAEAGIDAPFEIQRLTIADALAGRDVCGKAKTGSGKTLAFGVPVLQTVNRAESKHPRALVLVPTRELATQVADELAPLGASTGVRLHAVYGGTDLERQAKDLANGCDVVVATPGRLIDLIERGAADLSDVEIVVVDEAARMADMGFLPQVEWLLRHIDGHHQTLLFSATLDGAVQTLVERYQTDPVRHEVASDSVTVESMVHHFFAVHQMDKVRVVAAVAAAHDVNRTMVFVRTKRSADRLVDDLREAGVKAGAIHGDLRQKDRERSLARFIDGSQTVLVATDVAARGIHVDDVDVVVHFDPPEDHKSYLHRSGRTARAGSAGIVVTLVLWDQELEVRRLQKRIGVVQPIESIFSNDPRIPDLMTWVP
jgi:superfamily II DNA/RNA helicase